MLCSSQKSHDILTFPFWGCNLFISRRKIFLPFKDKVYLTLFSTVPKGTFLQIVKCSSTLYQVTLGMVHCALTLMSAQPCLVRRSPDTTAPPMETAPIQTEVTIAHACQDSLAMVSPAKVKLFHFHNEQISSKRGRCFFRNYLNWSSNILFILTCKWHPNTNCSFRYWWMHDGRFLWHEC